MSDTNRNQKSDLAAELFGKRDALLAERKANLAKRIELSARDREIDRELADVQAAGRVFGINVELPKEDDDALRPSFMVTHDALRSLSANLRRFIGPQQPTEPTTPAAKAVATKAEMPRIGDIVLDQLKKAGEAGTKARIIQDYIESTYGQKIHDKTVGMTLYRLAQDGLVRREGHTWFIVPETVNPGAATPGSNNLFD